jgi:hypothetical protein
VASAGFAAVVDREAIKARKAALDLEERMRKSELALASKRG